MQKFGESAVVILIGIIGLVGAHLIPPAESGETWAGLVPVVICISIVILGVIQFLSIIKADTSEQTNISWHQFGLILLMVLISLALWQSITSFGFFASNVVAAPLVMFVFGVRKIHVLALSALVCPLALHLFFFSLLGVFPPFAKIVDPLRLLGI